MERDFLGLSYKSGLLAIKEEEKEEEANTYESQNSVTAQDFNRDCQVACKARCAFRRNDESSSSTNRAVLSDSTMQWSFSNKVKVFPQFLSFKTVQEDRPTSKIVTNPLASPPTFMTLSSTDAFDRDQKPIFSTNLIQNKHTGNHYAMTVYPVQNIDAHSVRCPIFPALNQPDQVITPIIQSHIASTGQNIAMSTMTPQSFGAVPFVASVSSILPPASSMVGTTDLRSAPKSSGGPSQLTIFYDGTVNVYDDVSPEKANAIMLLAGNGSSPALNKQPSTAQEQAPKSTSRADDYIRNISNLASPFTAISSPLSLTPNSGSQCGDGSTCVNELAIVKPVVFMSSSNHKEPAKVVSSVGSAPIPTVAVPQARKASLARFLEKRKERAMHSSPYNVSKTSPDRKTPVSDGFVVSVNSNGSCSL